MDVSVIIPVYNEERNIPVLYNELAEALKSIKSWEIIFVDDGSTDNSLAAMEKLVDSNKNFKVIKLLSNYGQASAIAAGISKSSGRIVVTMDSDLQHDPRDIAPMVKKVGEGYDVVCGWRRGRSSSDSLVSKIVPSAISNFLVRTITGVKLKDSTGGMKAFSRMVVDTIPFYGSMNRYLPILAHWKGFKVTEVPINVRKRHAGKTKYSYKRLLGGFLDLLTIKFYIKYSTRPTHIFGTMGIASFGIGFFIGLFYVVQKLLYNIRLTKEIVPLLFAVILMLQGIMFFGFGFIADIISYDAIINQKRETYIIEKIIKRN